MSLDVQSLESIVVPSVPLEVRDDHARIRQNSIGLTRISFDIRAVKVILPTREGEFIEYLSQLASGDVYSLTYPGTASMKCVVAYTDAGNVFIGGRPTFEYARITWESVDDSTFRLTFESTEHDYVIVPFDEDWISASRLFRELMGLGEAGAIRRPARLMFQLGVRDPFGFAGQKCELVWVLG